ncbi:MULTISPECIES: hypothetical protein [Snodgrassella]|uniref:Uncharacterized protein n=1 Tax=Snodgrassella alvi TaxID=1196083 RepID=A0A2N9WR38_9NEIS|nr:MULTISPECIES: hypothetical protein [Snodgrassella]NUE65829.1 hypothetical protein [Snodgrassella sp. ESL0253]PIT12327.1 hypothetical protein BGI32_10200 [Snodgrassella alvi]
MQGSFFFCLAAIVHFPAAKPKLHTYKLNWFEPVLPENSNAGYRHLYTPDTHMYRLISLLKAGNPVLFHAIA